MADKVNQLAALNANLKADWDDNLNTFKDELHKVAVGVKAWLILRKPMFERWATEGGEGLSAFVVAILKGEPGRAEAMAKNTGSDTTTAIGFNVGLVEREAFWIAVQVVMAGGKVPTWLIPIIGEILKQVKGGGK
jgi:hypothetical protein